MVSLTNANTTGLCTKSPAVARMADRTAPVVKLTLILTLILPGPQVRRRLGARHGGRTGDNLAKQAVPH